MTLLASTHHSLRRTPTGADAAKGERLCERDQMNASPFISFIPTDLLLVGSILLKCVLLLQKLRMAIRKSVVTEIAKKKAGVENLEQKELTKLEENKKAKADDEPTVSPRNFVNPPARDFTT